MTLKEMIDVTNSVLNIAIIDDGIYQFTAPAGNNVLQAYYNRGVALIENHRHGGDKFTADLIVTLEYETREERITRKMFYEQTKPHWEV